MAGPISDRVERFIFDHIDSVALLDTMLTLHNDPTKSHTAISIASHLRGNPKAIEHCLKKLIALKIIVETSEGSNIYSYQPESHLQDEVIRELAQTYRVQPHRVFELIFSPMKRARDFADAFRISVSKGKKEGSDG